MHTEIDYSKLDGEAKQAKALADVKDWMGEGRFEAVNKELSKVRDFDRFEFYASLAGVQGYPVRAWFDWLRSLETAPE